MIKDLDRVLYVIEAVDTLWSGLHKIKSRFDLEEITNFKQTNITEMLGEITAHDSSYSIHPIEVKPYHYRGYGIFDSDMELISLFQISSHLGQSCLYQEWAILDGYNPTLYAFDKNDKENPRMEVNFDLEEDEHFQMMMLRAMPEYDSMVKVFAYSKQVLPALEVHKFVNPLSYEHLELDFSGIKFSDEILHVIDKEVSFDFIDDMFTNPNQSFRTQYNESQPHYDATWWK